MKKDEKKDVGPQPGPTPKERMALKKKSSPKKNPYGGPGERGLGAAWSEGYEEGTRTVNGHHLAWQKTETELLGRCLEEALGALVLAVEALHRTDELLSSYLGRSVGLVSKAKTYVDGGHAAGSFLEEFGGGIKHLHLLVEAGVKARRVAQGRTLVVESVISKTAAKLGESRVKAIIAQFADDPVTRETMEHVLVYYKRVRGKDGLL